MDVHSHSVQFYQDDTFLTESITRFIKEGLAVNETVLIIATALHREELRKGLTPQEVTHDKLWFLDASEQLSKFMSDGWPNERRFKNVVGTLIGPASKHGPVRVFGEMVALLWANGNPSAAMRLEVLWNELMKEQSFALLCAYPMANFSQENGKDSVTTLSRLHTHSHTQSVSSEA
jgi:hypothetical protein